LIFNTFEMNSEYPLMMKFVCGAVLTLLLVACTEKSGFEEDEEAIGVTYERGCASMEVLEEQMKADPSLRVERENIERLTRDMISSGRINALGKIEIPVIVNVLYRRDEENISDEQILSQIAVLNEDFNAKNADASSTPAIFKPLAADTDIQFKLEVINRKFSNRRSWDLTSAMKKSIKGGIDPVDPSRYLNIWVVNKILSVEKLYLGYAQFPGGNPATDGVVIGYQYFGRTGTVAPPYDKGRTTTHEVGHWMNLLHIWGDSECGTDLVSDTPQHATFNFGCQEYPHVNACIDNTIEMTMNFMDYSDDACMHLFTTGQKSRARAVFGRRGPRAMFTQDTIQ
jgi:hypothetical protein